MRRGRRTHTLVSAVFACACVTAGLLAVPAVAGEAVVDFSDFDDTTGLQLNGNAQPTTGVIRLTDDDDQAGSVFTEQRVLDPERSFKASFELQIEKATGSHKPADGMVFALIRGSSDSLGFTGSEMGFGGIGKSFGLEFDTYSPQDPPKNDHVAFIANGNVSKHLEIARLGELSVEPRFGWLDYKAGQHRLNFFYSTTDEKPAQPSMTLKYDLGKKLGADVRVGFTAGTGAFRSNHDLRAIQVTQKG